MAADEIYVDGFKAEYENNATESYLVIKAGKRCNIIRYQAEMVSSNDIRHIIPFEIKFCDDICYCYYNITSRLPLQAYLKRRKLAGNEFVRILSDITGTIVNSAGYLLAASSFLTKAAHIYIDPATLEIQLIYLPVKRQCEISAEIRDLVADLILNHVNLEEGTKDDYLHKILAFVRGEALNISCFHKFLGEMAAGDDQCPSQTVCEQIGHETSNEVKSQIIIPATGEAGSVKAGTSEAVKPEDNTVGKVQVPAVAAIIIIQFIIVGSFLAYFRFMDGHSRTAVLAALIMFAAAVEILVFGKLLKTGLIKVIKKDSALGDFLDLSISGTGLSTASNLSGAVEAGFSGLKVKAEESANTNEGINKSTISSIKTVDSINMTSINADNIRGNNIINTPEDYKTVILSYDMLEKPYLAEKYNPRAEKIIIDKPEFLVGRLEGQVDYVSGNAAVGKIHACINIKNGNFYITDLNSVNGTYLDGLRIDSNREYEIKNNCTIAFANSEYLFVSCSSLYQ